jgi:serine/threonine protein kinase
MKLNQWACRQFNEKYSIVKEIGQGAYGSVYEVYRIEDNKKFAVKKMENLDEKEEREAKEKKKEDKD